MTEPTDRPRCSVFIATSVDGFIARPDGTLDWLTGRPAEEETGHHDEGEDFGYGAFMATVDALVMGRGTYDVVVGFDGDWPYGDVPIYLWTHRPDDVVVKPGAVVRPVAGEVADVLARLTDDGVGHAYVDGGATISAFLDADAIDRLTISVPPVLIGTGIPLFAGVGHDIALSLVESTTYPGGMVQRTYDVVR